MLRGGVLTGCVGRGGALWGVGGRRVGGVWVCFVLCGRHFAHVVRSGVVLVGAWESPCGVAGTMWVRVCGGRPRNTGGAPSFLSSPLLPPQDTLCSSESHTGSQTACPLTSVGVVWVLEGLTGQGEGLL